MSLSEIAMATKAVTGWGERMLMSRIYVRDLVHARSVFTWACYHHGYKPSELSHRLNVHRTRIHHRERMVRNATVGRIAVWRDKVKTLIDSMEKGGHNMDASPTHAHRPEATSQRAVSLR